MRRDLDTLRRWAAAIERDARTRLPGAWRVAVDDSFVLTVSRDGLSEQVLLGDLVDEDAWPEAAWAPPHREATLDLEASEVVAGDFLEVLRLWETSWSPCPVHGATAWVCSATWLCPGPPFHALGPVGNLPRPRSETV